MTERDLLAVEKWLRERVVWVIVVDGPKGRTAITECPSLQEAERVMEVFADRNPYCCKAGVCEMYRVEADEDVPPEQTLSRPASPKT